MDIDRSTLSLGFRLGRCFCLSAEVSTGHTHPQQRLNGLNDIGIVLSCRVRCVILDLIPSSSQAVLPRTAREFLMYRINDLLSYLIKIIKKLAILDSNGIKVVKYNNFPFKM